MSLKTPLLLIMFLHGLLLEMTQCRPTVRLQREKEIGRTVRVPKHSNRFDIPWRAPQRPQLPTLKESRNRILYSGVREGVSDGLGHGMATVNADVSTAIRLGITYTHRTAKYGSLVGSTFTTELKRRQTATRSGLPVAIRLSAENSKVERFFGWGVHEIPREAVQDSACPLESDDIDVSTCKLCSSGPVANSKRLRNDEDALVLRVDQIVEIPMGLSYKWPHRRSKETNDSLNAFLELNNKPNTVFHMPHGPCNKSPAYSKFFPSSRAFFYYKYWDSHGRYPAGDERRKALLSRQTLLYRDSWVRNLLVPQYPGRASLSRLREEELTIAVHARRGDFFSVGRPMVTTETFARVIRAIVSETQNQGGPFASMGVAINVYSEGRPMPGLNMNVGHDVNQLTTDFHDANGTVLSVTEVESLFRDTSHDTLGNVFPNGLRVSLRVSENTILCLHEMIASDIFVGSESAMSQHLLGSLSRGSMQVLPTRIESADEWDGHVRFEKQTGQIIEREMNLACRYWREFSEANTESATRALVDKRVRSS